MCAPCGAASGSRCALSSWLLLMFLTLCLSKSIRTSPSASVTVHLPESSGPLEERVLTVVYDGKINDPPQASGGLRFVRPDKTYGHIGSEGVYLTYETFWHPTLKNTLSTYDLTVNLPSDWETVTQGHNTSNTVKNGQRTSQWSIQIPSEALTLAANHFI